MNTKSIKTAVVGTVAAAAMGTALIGSAQAGTQDFDLINDSGRTIERIFVSPVSTNDWENDVLGSFTLPSGYTKHVTFSPSYGACRFDVKVVFRDGSSLIDWNVNLCRVSRIDVT
jgi:hypothetical protein